MEEYVFSDESDIEEKVEEVVENKEITNPQPVEVEPITRVKKPRTEKQIKALEKARATRAAKLAEKKKAKEEKDKFLEENYHPDIQKNLEHFKATAVGNEPPPFIEDEIEEVPKSILKKGQKKKKVKKVIVNNYYEESSEEEIVEEQNNYYRGKKKKGVKLQPPPTQNSYEDYEEEVVATNNYSFNPYGNITFC
jgi:hypothetical protein